MSSDDELLDLVDANDHVIGTVQRSQTENLTSGYIRAVELLIQNDKGRLWIPRRQTNKRIAPGGLDYSMGGHVGQGETYEAALIRETDEELNLKFDKSKLELVNKFKPGDLPYFRTLYIYKSNQTPDYNTDDFSGAEWLAPQELLARLNSGEIAKSSLRETVEYLVSTQKTP